MADGKRRAGKRQEGDPKQGDAAERELERALEPGATDVETALEESPQPTFESSESFETDAELPEAELFAEARAAVDADIAAANSDVEAAAEDMGARQSLEPAQPGQAGQPGQADHQQPDVAFQPQFHAWPSVQPTFRRSKAEEANAFFAFTERLRQEFHSNDPGHSASVPVDPPDPSDRALFGPADSASPPEDEEDSEHYGEEYRDQEYDADDFYIGDDGYDGDGEDGQGDVEIDIETEIDEDDDPDGDESEY